MGRTERRYYVLQGTYMAWAWFMGPIYPLFLLSRGLDVLQASSVLATYFVVTFLFEIRRGRWRTCSGDVSRSSSPASCA